MKENNHKNIIKVLEIFENSDESQYWISMQWFDAKDLAQVIQENSYPLAEDVAKDYFKQMIDGLKFLHTLAIVHRDIKLDNFLLIKSIEENRDLIKFIDFGFSKVVDIKDGLAVCGSHCGIELDENYE